jgi:Zn-dependent peptidase ImmA (M78 family)/transcriptional regulator with XRE-family HTH domain
LYSINFLQRQLYPIKINKLIEFQAGVNFSSAIKFKTIDSFSLAIFYSNDIISFREIAMKDKIPINPKILKWARVSMGLTLEDAARKMGRKDEEIENWESGRSTPTYPQLEKLAYDVYKRPIAVFFFPEAPTEDTPKTEFRTLPDTIIDKLPVEIIKVYRKGKVFQIYLEELFDGKKPTSQNLIDKFVMSQDSNPFTLAMDLRDYIGISFDEQYHWKSYDTAFRKWRTAMESKGIFVFKDAFKNSDYSGFCIYHKYYPVILINNSMPFSRQIFTIFHELGHLLFHSGGVDFRKKSIPDSFTGTYSLYEKKCNQFAGEFLVPSEALSAFDLAVNEKHFEFLAEQFSVSREVILRNYLERGLISSSYYNKMAEQWIKQALEAKKKSKGGDYYLNQKAYLGESYINLAFGKYYQNKISAEALSNYLNIKLKNIFTFEQKAFS